MNSTYHLEADGEALPVVAEFEGHHYSAHVLHNVNGDVEWIVTWTDGINEWVECYELPWHALARLTALVAAAEQDVFLVHDPSSRDHAEGLAFVVEADRFVSRTVHASSCALGCDGTDPANHQA